MKYDALIIGAGVLGAAMAQRLMAYDVRIGVLEKAGDVCMGASKANSGIVHAGFDAVPGTKKAFYNVEGSRMYPELCERLNVPYRQCGALVVGFDEEDKQTLVKLYQQGRENGVKGMALLTGEEARQFEKNLSKSVTCALHVLSSGIVSPYEMTYGLMEHAVVNGVKVHLNAKVMDIKQTNGEYQVVCEGETFSAKTVINCAGIGALKIHQMVKDDDTKVIARKGEYYLLDRDINMPFYSTIFQCPTKMGKGVLVSPTVHGNTLIGPNAVDIDDFEDTATDSGSLKDILTKARLTWPALSLRTNLTTFAGIRAHEQNGDFLIQETADGFFEALGIESPGLTSAPAIAKEWGDEIADKRCWKKKKEVLPPYHSPKPFYEMTLEERKAAYESDHAYGALVCRCECVTEKEIVEAIKRPLGAVNVDGIKRRTRAGMGRCQGGFCSPRVMEILARETGTSIINITKSGGNSQILTGTIEEGLGYED